MSEFYTTQLMVALRRLSDRGRQQTDWIDDPNIWANYQEDVEAIFLDSGLTDAVHEGEVVFSKEADSALLALEHACDKIGYERPDNELIGAPEMEALRKEAAQVLALVLASDGSESTVQWVVQDEATI